VSIIRKDSRSRLAITTALLLITAQFISQWCIAESYRSPISSLECPDVTLEPAQSESGFISPRDTKTQELSYPIAATQLLDFYNKNVGNPKPSSAIVLALESQVAINSVENAIRTAQKNGICIDSPSLAKELDKELLDKPEQFVNELRRLMVKYPDEFDPTKIFSQQNINSRQISETNCISCGKRSEIESNAIKLILNSAPWVDRKKVILKVLEDTALVCGQAKRNLFPHLPNPTVKPISNTVELYSAIQDRFGSGSPSKKQPLALSICKPFLKKGRSLSGVDRSSSGNRVGQCSSPSDSLAVTVYGSRRDSRTGNCELKLKTPWGQSCKGYSPEWPCKNGDLWVDIETLGRNSFKAVYLNP
jgi:hypothetical protein